MSQRYLRFIWPVLLALLLPLNGCGGDARTPLRVFIAGSLVVPFAELERAYEDLHPEVDVQVEAHGSIQVIRHVTEIHDLIDVVVPADYALIPLLMYTSKLPDSDQPYADWYIRFASNQVVLAYTPQSLASDEINSENWYRILARPDVRFGLPDPRLDAAGYRALMIVQLAESYYGDPTLFERIFLGRFTTPFQVSKTGDQQVIQVPELLETRSGSNILLRGGSVALLGLLESGDIDYAFEYESVARQHNLEYIKLPAALNLGEPAQVEMYANILVRLDYQRFASVKPEFTGDLIGYAVTVPTNAPQPALAYDFVAFLLSSEGAAIMNAHDHPAFAQPQADNCEAVPILLQEFCDLDL